MVLASDKKVRPDANDSVRMSKQTDNPFHERIMADEVDQSVFALGMTHLRESRVDDAAAQYEATLTPDAVILQR